MDNMHVNVVVEQSAKDVGQVCQLLRSYIGTKIYVERGTKQGWVKVMGVIHYGFDNETDHYILVAHPDSITFTADQIERLLVEWTEEGKVDLILTLRES